MICAAASAMPPEYQEALTKPEVVSLVVGFIIAVIAALTALATLAKRWAARKLGPLRDDVAAVRYQAENNHGPDGKDINLRDQIDTIQREMREGFRRMDHQFGEIHDRQIQEAEDRQAVDSRLQALDRRAQSEHTSIWDAIRKHQN